MLFIRNLFRINGPKKTDAFKLPTVILRIHGSWGSKQLPSWWFQPIWKICSSNWIISPSRREIRNISNHQIGPHLGTGSSLATQISLAPRKIEFPRIFSRSTCSGGGLDKMDKPIRWNEGSPGCITWRWWFFGDNFRVYNLYVCAKFRFGILLENWRFQEYWYPKMDGLEWKTLLKWMIWVGFPTPIFGSTPKSWLMTAIAGGIHQLGDFSGVSWIHFWGEMDSLGWDGFTSVRFVSLFCWDGQLTWNRYYLGCGTPPRMQSLPPGWHHIFRIGDPELNLHLPLFLGGGTTYYTISIGHCHLHSLELIANAPENWQLEDKTFLSRCLSFSCELLVLGMVILFVLDVFLHIRWFKVICPSPSWRSLNPWKGHLTILKRSPAELPGIDFCRLMIQWLINLVSDNRRSAWNSKPITTNWILTQCKCFWDIQNKAFYNWQRTFNFEKKNKQATKDMLWKHLKTTKTTVLESNHQNP